MRGVFCKGFVAFGVWALFAGPAGAQSEPSRPSTASGSGVESAQRPLVTPPAPRRWSVGIAALYSKRADETSAWLPSVEINYSPNDRVQLHAMVPMVYDRLRGRSAEYGVGDLELGVRLQLTTDDPNGWRPAVSFYPLVQLPTGSTRKNLGTGRSHAFLPLWFSKTLGSWIPYGGGGYWINPGPGNKDWTLAALGVIRVLSPKLSLTGQVFYASSSKVGIPEQTGLTLGARYNVTDSQYVFVTATRGIQNVRETNQFTGYLQYVFTF
jgi:hypothetical protein